MSRKHGLVFFFLVDDLATIMKATALQSVGGKILTRTITVTPPQVPAGMVLKSFRIIPLRSIHIDRRFDPINLDIVNLMVFPRD